MSKTKNFVQKILLWIQKSINEISKQNQKVLKILKNRQGVLLFNHHFRLNKGLNTLYLIKYKTLQIKVSKLVKYQLNDVYLSFLEWLKLT